jgi:hypothetical protein
VSGRHHFEVSEPVLSERSEVRILWALSVACFGSRLNRESDNWGYLDGLSTGLCSVTGLADNDDPIGAGVLGWLASDTENNGSASREYVALPPFAALRRQLGGGGGPV